MLEGHLDAIKGDGGWRWSFITTGGAMYLGPSYYPTRKAALKEGENWLSTRRTSV